MSDRLTALRAWLGAEFGSPGFDLVPASSDASFRRYFRVRLGGESWIVMDAPPEHEDTGPFIRVAGLLAGQGLNVPRVLASDTRQGFLLLTDLGDTPYLQVLDADSADPLYGDALDALRHMQGMAPDLYADLPPYDCALLLQEMALFRDWYLGRLRGLRLDGAQAAALEAVFAALADMALAQPVVFVHRDYHSRNLMRTSHHNPGIIDFQDAVRGPVTYDLVSLLRDCYIRWPRARVEAWALGYLREARRAGIVGAVDEATWLRWFDWMGVQRHLKAAGIFARLDLRDGKPGYLADIPRTLGYVGEVAARHEALRPLLDFLPDEARAGGAA